MSGLSSRRRCTSEAAGEVPAGGASGVPPKPIEKGGYKACRSQWLNEDHGQEGPRHPARGETTLVAAKNWACLQEFFPGINPAALPQDTRLSWPKLYRPTPGRSHTSHRHATAPVSAPSVSVYPPTPAVAPPAAATAARRAAAAMGWR